MNFFKINFSHQNAASCPSFANVEVAYACPWCASYIRGDFAITEEVPVERYRHSFLFSASHVATHLLPVLRFTADSNRPRCQKNLGLFLGKFEVSDQIFRVVISGLILQFIYDCHM